MPKFYQTKIGYMFYERTMPQLVEAVQRLSNGIEKLDSRLKKIEEVIEEATKAKDSPEPFTEYLQRIQEEEDMTKREWEKQKAQAEAQAAPHQSQD